MFTGKIDRNRFPGVTQEYRFELEEDTAVPDEGARNLILEFLDLETCGEKRSFLQRHRTVKNGVEGYSHVCKDGPVFNSREVRL